MQINLEDIDEIECLQAVVEAYESDLGCDRVPASLSVLAASVVTLASEVIELKKQLKELTSR